MRKCLVFDGDDTLWFNAYKYHLPMIKCLEIICKELKEKSVHPLELLKLHNHIDKEMVAKAGFKKDRFPLSFVKTYRRICKERNLIPERRVEQKLLSKAYKFAIPPFPLVKGARKVLRKLKKRGYYLVLLTAGDRKLQKEKIRYNSLERYFDQIIITPLNKKEKLKKLAKKFGKENVWMIGNSKKSDIKAALQIPVKAIYIPCFTWDYEDVELDKKLYRKYVIECRNLVQLLEIF